jgi:coenzyme F420-reducing hydrogenase alpha subunit
MHNQSFDLSVKEISKIEGSAGMDVQVRGGKVVDLKLKLGDYKRFYTQAVRGKPVSGAPQFVARICGTCSNAHLLCSIEAVEKGLGIIPSHQTQLFRRLITNGLMIRDHALHLYVFCLPDVIGKDSILEFDENDPTEHQLLHDTFAVKSAGNQLSITFGGRSVHAPHPLVGGFLKFPEKKEIEKSIQLLNNAKQAVLRLINIYAECDFDFQSNNTFVALFGNSYDFLEGNIKTSKGDEYKEKEIGQYFNHVVKPYSQASGYKFKGDTYIVGALARVNLGKDKLNRQTKEKIPDILKLFPSTNIFDNNLAQAIEILHCIDDSLDILEKNQSFKEESLVSTKNSAGMGIV